MIKYNAEPNSVSKLSDDVSTGKGMVKILVFLGTVAAACIGFLNIR